MNCNSYYIRVFPSANSMHEGKPLSEYNLVTPVTRITNLNYKLTDDSFSLTKAGNNINIGQGAANINGYYIETTAQLTLTNATDGYIVIQLVRDSDNNLLGDSAVSQSGSQEYQGVNFAILTSAQYEEAYKPDILILGELSNGTLTESVTSTLRIDGDTVSVDKHFPDTGETSLGTYLGEMRDKFVPRYGESSIRTLTEDNGTYTLGSNDKLQFDPTTSSFVAINGESSGTYRYDKAVIVNSGHTLTIGYDSGLVLSYYTGDTNTSSLKLDDNITMSTSDLTLQLVGSKLSITANSNEVFSYDVSTGFFNTYNQSIITSGSVSATSLNVTEIDFKNGNTYDASLVMSSGTLTCNKDFSATRVHNAVYNDYAEFYEKEEYIEAGDVVEINPETGKCRRAQEEYSPMVVGVCTDNYGHILGGKNKSITENLAECVPVGLAGRVRVKVVGAVYPGELLCAAGSGFAMASLNPQKGTIIGKALEGNTTGRVLMQIMLG